MALRIPWDKEETALLIDAYLRVEAGRVPLKEAVSALSRQLRQRAERSGIEIDEVFRNENGIRMQLAKIQDLMTGSQSGLTNTSILYKDMLRLFQKDNKQFHEILIKAQKNASWQDFTKENFLEWLSSQMTAKKSSTIEHALAEVNDYAKKKKLLPGPVFEVTEPNDISRLRLSIMMNWWLRTIQRTKQIAMIETCSYYERYLLHKQKEMEERFSFASFIRLSQEVNEKINMRADLQEPDPIPVEEAAAILAEQATEIPLHETACDEELSDSAITDDDIAFPIKTETDKDSENIEVVSEKHQEDCLSANSTAEGSQAENSDDKTLDFVDFSNDNSYAYTKPVYIVSTE